MLAGNMIRSFRLSPYKGKWQSMFSQKLAMEELKDKLTNDNLTSSADLIWFLNSSFRRYGLKPGFPAYSFIIKDLIQRSLLQKLPPILSHLEEAESFEIPEKLFISIIKSYGSSNMLKEAVNMFLRIPNFRCSPSVRSLNSLLSVLCKRREGLGFIPGVLLSTRQMNLRLEDSSFMILLKALCKNGRVAAAVELLEEMKLHGFSPDLRIYSLILSSLYKQADAFMIISFFEEMKAAGISLRAMDYTCVINTLVKEGRADDAYELLREMRSSGLRTCVGNYAAVLGGFVSSGEFQKGEQVFDDMLLRGLCPDSSAYNTYIDGLCRQGKVEEASKMLVCMEKMGCRPDSSTYGIIIGGCFQVGEFERARQMMEEMKKKGFMVS